MPHLQPSKQATEKPSGKAIMTAALEKAGLLRRDFVGMVNRRNDCFANTIIQSLLSVPEVVALFLDLPAVQQGFSTGPGSVSRTFSQLVCRYMTTAMTPSAVTPSPVSPAEFIMVCGAPFTDGEQHDIQEFLWPTCRWN